MSGAVGIVASPQNYVVWSGYRSQSGIILRMIRMLTGIVADTTLGTVVVDVGGVGYVVALQAGRGSELTLGQKLSLHTYLAVREDALDLYGFFSRDDLEMFELLIDLPKIGPKSAMQILSQADVALLKKAVATEDAIFLSKMSGLGKKTAEKIVLGLKDKFEDMEAAGGGAHRSTSDVIDALLTLGYSQKEARDAVAKLDPTLTDTNARVKAALQMLSN